MTPLDISATQIRSLLQKGASPRYLMPENVIAHIHEHHYYTEN
jgi:nicotinate-nucleotide adenylyltransferase